MESGSTYQAAAPLVAVPLGERLMAVAVGLQEAEVRAGVACPERTLLSIETCYVNGKP